ncbi:MAG: metallophosphoesterase [Erysipelotrichales bacterium]|nr:metallophosphoesterase [Erysipelotrichales bacterium]
MKKLIIFPDIHGRKFWKEPFETFKNNEDYGFIFLGDYIDAYKFENISENDAIDNFKEILDNCINHPRTTMLVGNHDIHYLPPLDEEYGCRRYDKYKKEIQKLFLNNIDKFRVCHIEKIGDTRYVFSHAGFLKSWIEQASYGLKNLSITLDNVNDLLYSEDGLFALSMYGYERGARSRFAVGSCVWADIQEHLGIYDRFEKNIYQIFAHNQAFPYFDDFTQYYICEDFAMLDAQKPFVLDLENGKLSEL